VPISTMASPRDIRLPRPLRLLAVVGWIRKRHHGLNWATIRRHYLPARETHDGNTMLYRPRAVATTRHRYRGARIDTPWASTA